MPIKKWRTFMRALMTSFLICIQLRLVQLIATPTNCLKEKPPIAQHQNGIFGLPFIDDVVYDDDYHRQHEQDIKHWKPLQFDTGFDWSDVDLRRRGSCGQRKCYWPSVSDKESKGYLVTTEGHYSGMRQSMEMADRLKQECHMKQLYTEPAVLVNVTTAFMKHLDVMTHNPSRYAVGEKTPRVFYVEDVCVVVQRVASAPFPHLLHGRGGTKWEAVQKSIPAFRKQLRLPLAEVRRNLQRERKRIECIFQHEHAYWYDFQLLVDTAGNGYHLDLEHHFSRQFADEEEHEGIQRALKYVDRMIDMVTSEHQIVFADDE